MKGKQTTKNIKASHSESVYNKIEKRDEADFNAIYRLSFISLSIKYVQTSSFCDHIFALFAGNFRRLLLL